MSLVQEKHSSIVVSNSTINTINKFKKDLQSSLNDYNKENIHKKVNETLEKLNKKNENKRSILDLDSITAIADEIKSNLKKKKTKSKSKSKQKPNLNNVSSISKQKIHSSLPKSYSNAILNKKMSLKSLSTNIISPNKSIINKENNINLSITKIDNTEENKYDHYIKENIYQVKKKQKIYHYKYRRVIKERSLLKEKPYVSLSSKRIFDVKVNEINPNSNSNHVYKSTKSGIFFNKSPLYKRVSSVIKYKNKEKDNLIALYKMKEMKEENDFYKQSKTKQNVSKSDFSTWRNENLKWEEMRKMKINHLKEVKGGLIDSKIYKYTGFSNSNQIDETNNDKIFTNQYSKLINNNIYPNKEKFLNRLDLYENKKNNNRSLILKQSLPSFCPNTINYKSTSIVSSKVNKERILNTTNFLEDEDRKEKEKIYTKQKIKGKKYRQDNTVNQNKSKVNNKLQERMTIDEEKNSLCNSNYDINIRENTFWENKENILFANNRYKDIFEFI